MTQGAPDGWKVIGLFPSHYSGHLYPLGTYQLSAREGDNELIDFKARHLDFGPTFSAFARNLEMYDSKGNLIGAVSKKNITLGQLEFPMGGGATISSTTSSFTFDKENYQMSIEDGAKMLRRNRDAVVLAKFQELVYYGTKFGLGDIILSPEAFTSNLHLAIIAFIVWQTHALVQRQR
jgi:hypothetical protein